ncbi:MAG: hypothetical protein WD039_00565 [Xanthobacteraceae bacterium]
MKFVRCIMVCAAVAAASPAAATPEETRKWGKDDLITLYLLSVAADRCAFPMTARQADAIDQAARSLAKSLKLGTRQTNALYSQADIEFERQGPDACNRNGDFARTFKETLQKMTGP